MIAAADASKIMGVRAGDSSAHRFTGVWPVVVNRRLFARSWTVTPGGWYRSFLDDQAGVIQVGERQLRVRAIPVRAATILDAIEDGYAKKYPTPGAQTYVRGFRTARRRSATLEFVKR